MDNEGEILLNKIESLVPIYEEVKNAILLCEYEDGLKLPIECINELRYSLDHVIRAVASKEDTDANEQEFIQAKAHLYRAGNDAFEILAMFKLSYLNTYQEQFDKEAIHEIFPDYFSSILPLVEKSKKQLAKVRARKPVIDEEENTFRVYGDITAQLMQSVESFQFNSNGILQYQKSVKKKKLKEKFIDYLIGGIVVGVIVYVIVRFVFGDNS